MASRFYLLGIVLMLSNFAASGQSPLTDSLIAYYPFNGNANDATGNGSNGTVNGATLTTDRFGNQNSAYLFDGISNYIAYALGKNFQPTSFPISITAWIKSNCAGPTNIFDNYNTLDTYGGAILGVNPPSGGLLTINYGNGGVPYPGSRRDKLSVANINDNQWHFVAGVIRGPLDMDLYIDCNYDNGTYDGSADTIRYTNSTGGVAGRSTTTSAVFYKGVIDEIRLYHRALTKTDLELIYSYPRPYSNLSASLGPDTILNCNGSSILIQPSVIGNPLTYKWSDNETTSSISVNQPGFYNVTVFDGCRFSSDTIKIIKKGEPLLVSSSYANICLGSGLTSLLSANGNGNTYQWQSSGDSIHFSSVNGATSNYFITPTTLSQTSYYRVFEPGNSCGDTSVPVGIHVNPAPIAVFSYSTNGNMVSFNSTGTSNDVTEYGWDFGDSSVSNEANPVHIYKDEDSIYVCLTVYNGSNCSYTSCKSIDFITGITNIMYSNPIQLYPNPAGAVTQLAFHNLNGKYVLKLYNSIGEEVMNKEVQLDGTEKIPLNISSLKTGIYQLGLFNNERYYFLKLMKAD